MTGEDAPVQDEAGALAAAELARFGTVRIRALGSSMLPALRPGDELRIDACDADTVGPGDIVLARCFGRLVVHRVVARTEGGLRTQGDRLRTPDPEIPAPHVLGRLVGVVRDGRELAPTRPSRLALAANRWLAASLSRWRRVPPWRPTGGVAA